MIRRRYDIEIYDNEGDMDDYMPVQATDDMDTAYMYAEEYYERGRISVRIYDNAHDTYLYY